MNGSLKNKTMIVTGASSGIGAAVARRFAAEGVKLALVARSAERLKALAGEVGSEHVVLPLDLTKPADVAAMVKATTDKFGHIDILFANAGSYVAGDVAEGDPDEWDRVVDINVKSVFRAVRAVLPDMIARRSGDIVVTSSISGHQAIHWEPVYSGDEACGAIVRSWRAPPSREAQCADRLAGAGDGPERTLGPDRSGRDRTSGRGA